MTVNGNRQNIMAIPFGSENGMILRTWDSELERNIDKPIGINEKVFWIHDGKRVEGYVEDKNHILVEKLNTLESVEIPYGALIEDGVKFQGVLIESADQFDIRYNATDIQMYHAAIYTSAFIPEISGMPKISLVGAMDIEIKTCKGIIDGVGFNLISRHIVKIEKGAALPRIDTVVIRKSQKARNVSIEIVKGVPAVVPNPPEIKTENLGEYELVICNVFVKPNAVSLNSSDIDDKRIVLPNVYGADYVIGCDWDLKNLCKNNIKADTVLLLIDVESYDYKLPSSVKVLKTPNASKITGSIEIENVIIENIIFNKGNIKLSSCRVKNAVFTSECEKLQSLNTKFEKCVIDTKVDFQKTSYIDNGFVGEIKHFAGAKEKIPEGWLLCDGAAVGRDIFKELFSVIGTIWGVGNGTSTFNLPDGLGGILKHVGASVASAEKSTIYNNSAACLIIKAK